MAENVLVYTTPTWPTCDQVKEFLSQRGVSFTEKDISKDDKALDEMGRRAQQTAVPTLIVDGQVIVGFDKSRLNKVFC